MFKNSNVGKSYLLETKSSQKSIPHAFRILLPPTNNLRQLVIYVLQRSPSKCAWKIW